MMKFTPGPWVINYSDGSGDGRYICSGDKAVAKIRWGCSCCEDMDDLSDVEIANAKLIAAAPELLHALNGLANAYKVLCQKHGEIDILSAGGSWYSHSIAAIAKAEGNQ